MGTSRDGLRGLAVRTAGPGGEFAGTMLRMEEQSSQSEGSQDLPIRSAAALRELQQRAHSALAASRDHVSRLETEMNWQLEQIAAALNAHNESEGQAAALEESRTDRDRLRAEFEAARAEWSLERESLDDDRRNLAEQVAALEAGLRRSEEDWQRKHAEVEQSLEQQQSDWNLQRANWSEERAGLARERAELDAKFALALEEAQRYRERTIELEQELSRRPEASEADSAVLVALQADRAELEKQRDEAKREVARVEAEQRRTNDEWQKQLSDFEHKLAEQHGVWNEQRTAWGREREELERERNELCQKFELALEDVQRFRGRITELEQELARRPEASAADSAELVALRAERDALAERIEELEHQPATPVDSNSEQQFADLQRRFELAVEDVRDLKKRNAQLEEQINSSGASSAAATDSGSMDWESQKRRLLASLEDAAKAEGDLERKEELVSIENTIEMTDAIVAAKDREIVELKARLMAGVQSGDGPDDYEEDAQINELLDADSIIAEHRKRVAELEREMEEKLRTAELELSVERAKIARQKAELEDIRAEIQSQRHAFGESGGSAEAGGPRRRWLSKLGLSGEEQ